MTLGLPRRRIGIIGGGQLGLMLAQSCVELGADVAVLDPDGDAPARRSAATFFQADYSDTAALQRLFDASDVCTYEFENLDAAAIEAVQSPTPLWPSTAVLRTAQDRGREKPFFTAQNIPTVRYVCVERAADFAAAAASLGYPLVAKTARGGYDGKGQVTLRSPDDLAVLRETPGGWIFEERVQILAEVSCIVARGGDGEEQIFPIFENLHREHILDTTIVPARLDESLAQQARQISLQLARALGVVGLLTIEFFVTPRGLVVNELAPRPHNSGHVTRRATRFSQFAALARVLCRVPIGEPVLRSQSRWAMGNLLGDVWPAAGPLDLAPWQRFPAVAEVYLYGKREPKPKRKMGHFLVEGATAEEAEEAVQQFRAALRGPLGR